MGFVQKAGCGGFPVAQSRYFAALRFVEIESSFFNLPRVATAHAWRAQAPAGFDFALRAWQLITHPAESSGYSRLRASIAPKRRAFCGHFKPTPEVERAWEETRAVAEALGARFIVFETPSSFYPDANHLRDLYRFFQGRGRGDHIPIWDPGGAQWTPKLISKVCADLKLAAAARPWEGRPGFGPLNYVRLPPQQAGYEESRLDQVRQACREKPSYVVFRSRDCWREARRYGEGA